MAAIYLDNLVKPKNYTTSVVSPLNKKTDSTDYTFTDLHLDLQYNSTLDLLGKDIVVDYDVMAIRNSLINILTNRPGDKVLNPLFGCRIDAYLFEAITDFKASMLGKELLNTIETYEPRIEVLNVSVQPMRDIQTYYIKLVYKIKDKGLLDSITLDLRDNNLTTIGATTTYTAANF
jgi:phage baseplate assembly protein W